jgi:hypothetical protein
LDPGSKISRIRFRIKELSIFNLLNCFGALGKMIRDVHPESRLFPLPDPVAKTPYPGSETLVRQVRSGLGSGLQALDADPDLEKW